MPDRLLDRLAERAARAARRAPRCALLTTVLAFALADSAPAQAGEADAAIFADLHAARRSYEAAMAGVRVDVRAAQAGRRAQERYERIAAFRDRGEWPDNCAASRKLADDARRAFDGVFEQCLGRAVASDDALADALQADWQQWQAIDDALAWRCLTAAELQQCNTAEPQQVHRRWRRARISCPVDEAGTTPMRCIDTQEHLPELRRYRVAIRGRAHGDDVEVALPLASGVAVLRAQVADGGFEVMATYGADQRLVVDYGAEPRAVAGAKVLLPAGAIGVLGVDVALDEVRIKAAPHRVPDALAARPRKATPKDEPADARASRRARAAVDDLTLRIELFERLAQANLKSQKAIAEQIERLPGRADDPGRSDLQADLGLARATGEEYLRILAREREKLVAARLQARTVDRR
ncbi:MAG: hypothetical protein ACK5AL_13530 [Planctomycetota bacterium]